MTFPDPALMATYLTGIAVVVGILGSVIPILPGVGLQLIAITAWALFLREPAAFASLIWTILVIAGGTWWQWRHPRLRADGPDTRMMVWCGAGAILGGLIVPVVGVVLGLCAGVIADQRWRGVSWRQAFRHIPVAVRTLIRYKVIELAQALCIGIGWEVSVLVIFQGRVV